MASDLQRCVAEYERQAAADAATADHSLLADGLAAFDAAAGPAPRDRERASRGKDLRPSAQAGRNRRPAHRVSGARPGNRRRGVGAPGSAPTTSR